MTEQKKMASVSIALIAGLFLTSCTPKPEKIAFGKDNCAECKMPIMDPKFGGEIVTKKGKCTSLMIRIVWLLF